MTNFKIALNKLPNLTHDCFQILFTGIAALVSLEILSVDLSWNSQIDDIDITVLASGIRQLKKLRELSLDLSNCSKITDLGILMLSISLRGVRSMVSIQLILKNCLSNITQFAIDVFKTRMIHNWQLTELNIQFS